MGLGSQGVALRCGGVTARLAWADHDPRWNQPNVERAGTWWVTWIRASRRTGIAIGLDRNTELEIDGAKAAAIAWCHVFAPFSRGVDEVALRTPTFTKLFLPVMDQERDTLRALCQSMATRPALRSRLAEPERAGHLVAAMAARPLRARREVWGLRPSTTAVLGALRRLGHRHEIGGRPLPGEARPDLEVIVDQVLDSTGRNPYRAAAGFDRDTVARTVTRHFLDVAPWPFAALTTPAASPRQP